jgi:hypothetical protein
MVLTPFEQDRVREVIRIESTIFLRLWYPRVERRRR